MAVWAAMNGPGARIPFHVPTLGPLEAQAAAQAVAAGLFEGDGPICRRVEEALRARTGSRHALLVTSATHALELALLLLEVGPGDEVVLPSFTFPSAANAILLRGARPVFADVRADTLELDAQDVARVLSPATRAVLAVDYGGVGSDLGALRAVLDAARPGIAIVEDAAQGLGAFRDGVHLGVGARAGALSFHASKNVACGEGGALLLQDDALAGRAEVLREKGTDRAAFRRGERPRYEWVATGSSWVLSDLLASVLEVQLRRADEITAARLGIARRYDEGLADLYAEGRLIPQTVPAGCRPNGHLYAVRTADAPTQRALRAHLAAAGIDAPFHFVPLHTTAYARAVAGPPRALPVTEAAWNGLLRLPIHPSLDRASQERVVRAVREGLGARPN